jgi:hypothetical protein
MGPLDVLSLEDAKSFLRVDFDDEDDLITSLISMAVGLVERTTEYRLYQRNEVIYTTGNIYYEAFQYPLNGATVINQDSADTTVYIPKFSYETLRTIIGWGNGFIYWDSWYTFFTNYYYQIHGDMCVTFILTLDVGYTDTSLIPTDLITAIKQIISYCYENRDMTKLDMPSNITMLLANYRRFSTLL